MHNPTVYGFLYFMLNLFPFVILQGVGVYGESGVFSAQGMLQDASVIQEQIFFAVTSLIFWLFVAAGLGIICDRLRAVPSEK